VFFEGMKIVVDKNLENTIWQCVFEGFLQGFMNYICIFKAFGVILLHFEIDLNASGGHLKKIFFFVSAGRRR
jgi:hypothetical protein